MNFIKTWWRRRCADCSQFVKLCVRLLSVSKTKIDKNYWIIRIILKNKCMHIDVGDMKLNPNP